MKKNPITVAKKFIATLPYLLPLDDKEIDQLEIKFHWEQELKMANFKKDEDRFLYWLMELENNQLNHITDNYFCLRMERSWRELNAFEADLFHKLERMDNLWTDPYYGYSGGFLSNHSYDDIDDDLYPENDLPVYEYDDLNYFDWDMSTSIQEFEDSFCAEQELVRLIPLKGLKEPVRKALIREYRVI